MVSDGHFSWNTEEAENYNNKYEEIFGKKGPRGLATKVKQNAKLEKENSKETINKV